MDLRSVLWEAVNSPLGVEVKVSDKEAFKRRFYSERAKARTEGIFDFERLQLLTPQPITENTWWIYHGQVQSKKQGEVGEEINPTL